MSKMLVKFENKSHRVKGLAFHPKRPWILASLHNGVIQLWDYRVEVKIDQFEEHEGPVRGVDFHISQPIFVSGGDDQKIKVWNYQSRRCLFNLIDHVDYIRTVQFHREYPWILSSSDDQTVKIWNWQSRQCIATLAGHGHYVMCAQFHPREDLVLSASLDTTVRVWDVSGLRKKTVSITSDFGGPSGGMGGLGMGSGSGGDLFGQSDVQVKHVLEGHTRGVNWASFHRNLSLVVSGADDREVKLWRMNDAKAWEVDTCRGHVNNVSCVLFHPKRELIVSNSEDKTIRVWDMQKQTAPLTLRPNGDRYWILAAHPNLNLMAAGHDSGLVIFKLERERPPYQRSGRHLFYYKDQYVYQYSFRDKTERPLFSTRGSGGGGGSGGGRGGRGGGGGGAGNGPRSLTYNEYNRSQHCVLLCNETDYSYELHTFPKQRGDGGAGGPGGAMGMDADGGMGHTLRGSGRAAVFVSSIRFAVLDKSRQVFLKSLKNEVKRQLPLAGVNVLGIFEGGVGRLLLRVSDKTILYDINSLKPVAELATSPRHPIKCVHWSPKNKHVALCSKANIYVATGGDLLECCTVAENTRIKSGAWVTSDVFLYVTATHIKYVIPNGDTGIVGTLENPVYVTAATTAMIYFLDREGNTGQKRIDATEFLFKVALWKRDNREVLKLVTSGRLVGQSIIQYLQKKGYPEVALHFVQDDAVKFDLALECGNIGVALDCAVALDRDDAWNKLGQEALRQGNHRVVEHAYQKTKNYEGLSFLYLLTGNSDYLSKMYSIAGIRKDQLSRFHNALYLGNAEERCKVLQDAGQTRLAYMCAVTHGLQALAAELEEKLSVTDEEKGGGGGEDAPADEKKAVVRDGSRGIPLLPDLKNAQLLFPPTPILREANWPLLATRKGFLDEVQEEEKAAAAAAEAGVVRDEVSAPEVGDSDNETGGGGASGASASAAGKGGEPSFAELGFSDSEEEGADKRGADGSGASGSEGDGDGGWGGLGGDDLGLDLGDDDAKKDDLDPSGAGDKGDLALADIFVMPRPGQSASEMWQRNSTLPADLVAAGDFNQAMHLLNQQIGVVDFKPLKAEFIKIWRAAHCSLQLAPFAGSLRTPLYRGVAQSGGKQVQLPHLCTRFDGQARVAEMYRSVTRAAFAAALAEGRALLQSLPLCVVDSKQQEADVREVVNIAREYLTAMRLEMARAAAAKVKTAASQKLAAQYACYTTRSKLQPIHSVLFLGRIAIKQCVTLKNFATTATLCRRVLELAVTQADGKIEKSVNLRKIKQVLGKCEEKNADAVPLDYPDMFTLCCGSLSPIPKGTVPVQCPFCQSNFLPKYEGTVCATCELSQVGAPASGLRVLQ